MLVTFLGSGAEPRRQGGGYSARFWNLCADAVERGLFHYCLLSYNKVGKNHDALFSSRKHVRVLEQSGRVRVVRGDEGGG